MIQRLLIGAIILLGTTVVLFLYLPKAPPPAQQATTGEVAVGGPFELVNSNGETVTEEILKGHHSLVFFGFTYCPDICPMTMQTIAAALDQLGPAGESILPVLITVDPERDTPEVMGEYVANFHPRLIGLTGSIEQVNAAAVAYKVYARKNHMEDSDGNPTEDYLMDHTGLTYLMGPDGKYVDHFGNGVSADEIAARLKEVLASP
jgi:cytochrome oxidase Cu insertion factor (SCO1/SenC/PrrC family)